MSLTLTENIDATQETMTVTGTVPDSIRGHFPFTLGSEILTLRTFGTTRPHRNGSLIVNRQEWICSRGQQGSAKAAHDAGTELKSVADAWVAGTDITPADPLASNSGSGGVTVTGSQGGSVAGAGEVVVTGVVTEQSPGVAKANTTIIAPDDPPTIAEAALEIDMPEGSENHDSFVLIAYGEVGNTILALSPYGELTVTAAVVDPTNGGGVLNLKTSSNAARFIFQANDGSGGDGVAKMGLFGHSTEAQQTVTGSTGGNAALESLIAALAAYGLIVDETE